MNHHNKGRTLPPEPLTVDEVRRLIQQCRHRCPTGIRNRALLVLLWRGQLRVSEALDLMPSEVDTTAGTARVLCGKGRRYRLAGLDAEACAVLDRWIDCRKSLGFNGRHHLLCTLEGKRLQSQYVRNLMKRLARKAGIDKRVHAHGLRHTGAFELANEGVPVHVIQKQLGHASASVTSRYIDHLAPQQVIDTMRSRTW